MVNGAKVSAVDGDENKAMICAFIRKRADVIEVSWWAQSVLVVSIVQDSFILECQFFFLLDPQSVFLYCSDWRSYCPIGLLKYWVMGAAWIREMKGDSQHSCTLPLLGIQRLQRWAHRWNTFCYWAQDRIRSSCCWMRYHFFVTSSIKCFNSCYCLKALLANGAAVDAENDRGRVTALMIAAERGHLQVVEVSVSVETIQKLGRWLSVFPGTLVFSERGNTSHGHFKGVQWFSFLCPGPAV